MTVRLFVKPSIIGICLGCWEKFDGEYNPDYHPGEQVFCDCERPSGRYSAFTQYRTYTKRRAWICPTRFCAQAFTKRMMFLEHRCEEF